MNVSPIRSEFACMTDERYSDAFCAVCGWGIRHNEETTRDENGCICHTDCIREENDE